MFSSVLGAEVANVSGVGVGSGSRFGISTGFEVSDGPLAGTSTTAYVGRAWVSGFCVGLLGSVGVGVGIGVGGRKLGRPQAVRRAAKKRATRDGRFGKPMVRVGIQPKVN